MTALVSKPLSLLALAFATGCATGRPAGSTPGGANPPSVAPFQASVLDRAGKNDAYRRVLFTGARSQLVLMAIPVGGDIGLETHAHVEQLIFIASGQGKAIVNGVETPLSAGDVLVATPLARHNVVNTGSEPLRIYTVYAPPNHLDGRVQETKADAQKDGPDEAFGAAVR